MTQRIVILGGGSAGLTTALALQKRRPPQSASITLVDQAPYYHLPAVPARGGGRAHRPARRDRAAAQDAEARRKVIEAAMTGLDSAAKKVTVDTADGA